MLKDYISPIEPLRNFLFIIHHSLPAPSPLIHPNSILYYIAYCPLFHCGKWVSGRVIYHVQAD